MKPRVYVIGPVNTVRPGSECDQFLNVRRMVEAATDLVELGFDPTVPALWSFWQMIAPQHRSFWIDKGRSDIAASAACFRIEGESSGADADELFAEQIGVPVFRSLEGIVKCFAGVLEVSEALANGVEGYDSAIVAPSPIAIAKKPCEACDGSGSVFRRLATGSHAGNVVRENCAECGGEGEG